MKTKRIICISHTFIKKINLSFYQRVSEDKNFKVTCIGPESHYINKKKYYPDYDIKDIDLDLRLLRLKFKYTRFFYFPDIIKIIREIKPHLILLDNDTVSLQSIILIVYSFFFNFKISYFCNENDLKNLFKNFQFKKLLKIILLFSVNSLIKRKINKIFCYTEQIKKNYDFLGYVNKTIVMPLGYNEKIFKIDNSNNKNDKFIISYFGQILPVKGIHTLLKSLENLKFDNWVFMLDVYHVNNKNYFKKLKPELKKLIKINKLKLIKCDYFEITKYMAISDLVVVPSEYNEQYGRVIQESVASGTLVIGSNIGAIPEIIDDQDLLFKPGNSTELALKINQLYFNKDFRDKKFTNLYNKVTSFRSITNQVNIFKKNI